MECLERTDNVGVPFLLLWLHGGCPGLRAWFAVLTDMPRLTVARAQRAQGALRAIMAGLLIGHGAFGLVMGKASLLRFYGAAGLGGVGVPLPTVSAVIGACEVLLGVLCLEVQAAACFLFVCAWKFGTKCLHVPAEAYGFWWEVRERGVSYAAPLLWLGVRQALPARCAARPHTPRSHWLPSATVPLRVSSEAGWFSPSRRCPAFVASLNRGRRGR